jgi:hypothetical protein
MCQLESNSRKLLPKLVGANVIKKKRTEKAEINEPTEAQ